jgi:hypothetical protein
VLLLNLFALLSGATAPGGLYKILVVYVLTLACVAACVIFKVRLFIGIDFRAHQALISRLKVQRRGNVSKASGELGCRRTLVVFVGRRLLHSGVSLRRGWDDVPCLLLRGPLFDNIHDAGGAGRGISVIQSHFEGDGLAELERHPSNLLHDTVDFLINGAARPTTATSEVGTRPPSEGGGGCLILLVPGHIGLYGCRLLGWLRLTCPSSVIGRHIRVLFFLGGLGGGQGLSRIRSSNRCEFIKSTTGLSR